VPLSYCCQASQQPSRKANLGVRLFLCICSCRQVSGSLPHHYTHPSHPTPDAWVLLSLSFLTASLSADYERRFKRRLVTKAIYPQNSREQPVYNPHGKTLSHAGPKVRSLSFRWFYPSSLKLLEVILR
jgi:hypothetical protein